MSKPLSRGSSRGSSDLFGPDDPDFLESLLHMKLPGDVSRSQHARNPLKRSHSPSPSLDLTNTKEVSRDTTVHDISDDNSEIYGESRFGGFGEYMRRKRAKLQIQNSQMVSPDITHSSDIFRDLAIYINGWTEPSVQDLRQLILEHGGRFHAYLDRKALVTHIITCSLTPAKVREFKHMKVVRPEWLVESAKAGELLPWQDFIFHPVERVESHQGTMNPQKNLVDAFATRQLQPSASHNPTGVGSRINIKTAGVQKFRPEKTPPLQPGPSKQPISPPEAPSKAPLPAYTTDPGTPAQAARVPGYAAHASNPHAQRVMADPEWRSAHTSAAPDFIEGYYKNSRLHHLSTWKAELKGLVAEAQERAESVLAAGKSQTPYTLEDKSGGKSSSEHAEGNRAFRDVSMKGIELVVKSPKSKGKAKADQERIIMHCDFDCFFVSAGLVARPHLRGKPVVVCHSQGSQGGGSSTSEIASSSYEARKYGIKNGMSLQQARKLCPTVMTIPYEFELYKQFSLKFYTILMSHADDLQAVSVDEALIEVTSGVEQVRTQAADCNAEGGASIDPAKEFAEMIRDQVRRATGCEVSIGIAHNILLARIATRQAKPAGSYHLLPAEVQNVLSSLDIADLHGFGSSTRQKAVEKLGASKLSELASKSKSVLCDALGKATGETLYKAIRGIDDRKLESDKPRKSVSCDITYGIRFDNNEQAEAFVFQMAAEVSRRLEDIQMHGRSVTLKIMKRDPTAPIEAPKFLGHGLCETFNKQMPLAGPGGRATSDSKIIGEHAWGMLKSFNFDPKDLRGIGIQIQKLESSSAPVNPGQARLPFKALEGPTKTNQTTDSMSDGDLEIIVHPPSLPSESVEKIEDPPIAGPSKPSDSLELPSLSQVDRDVLDALPDEVRQELEAEYRRISPVQPPMKPRSSRLTIKGTTNIKRITQQLAPRNRPVMTSPEKNRLLVKQEGPSAVHVSDAQLRKLDIDPEVFRLLPVEVQSEQLALARQAKSAGVSPLKLAERKVIKPYKPRARSSSASYHRRPPPQANHPQPPFLKQQGKEKGTKLYFTEAADVQRVIETWVEGFREHPPNQRDVDYFAKFLLESLDGARSTDAGIEKAVQVMKWWLMLLKRYWSVWENEEDNEEDVDEEGRLTSKMVGKVWWRAFRSVKEKMDVAIRKRFGGCLALK